MGATPLPVVADPILQVVMHGSCTAGDTSVTPAGNTFYYRRSVAGSNISKAAFKVAFTTAVITPLLAATNQAYSPNRITVRNVQDALDLPVDITVAGTGAIATDSEPSVDAVVMELKTQYRGRNARGFKHFGGTNEIDTIRDILSGAGLVRWQAVRDGVAAAFVDTEGNTWQPFILSNLGSQLKKNPIVARGADVNIVDLNLQIGTMRKRKAVRSIAA